MVCFLDPVFVSFMYSVNTHKDAEHGDFNVCILFFSLWKLFLKDITQGKRETYASKPRTGVEFGSHDTLIEQGSSSRSHCDYVHKATTLTYRMNVIQRHFHMCEC